jgi:hypothetical protein
MWWHTRRKTDFVFQRKGLVHLNRRGRQFFRLLAAEVCASAVVMLDTPCSEVVRRVLATHCTRQFPLHFPSRASPCDITFQLYLPQKKWKLLLDYLRSRTRYNEFAVKKVKICRQTTGCSNTLLPSSFMVNFHHIFYLCIGCYTYNFPTSPVCTSDYLHARA